MKFPGSLIKKDKIETFVLEGSNINEILKPHEKPFQEALDKSELKMGKYSRNLAKRLGMHIEKNGTFWDYPHYRKKIRNQMIDSGYIEEHKIKKLVFIPKSKFKLTENGKNIKTQFESILSEYGMLDQYYDDLINFKDYSKAMATNLFILNQDTQEQIERFIYIFISSIGPHVSHTH